MRTRPFTYLRARSGRGLVYGGVGLLFAKSKRKRPRLGSEGAAALTYRMRGLQPRCVKHRHLVDRRCAVCPIDGSEVTWQPRP